MANNYDPAKDQSSTIMGSPVSEYISLVLGAIGIFFLSQAIIILNGPSDGFSGLAAVILIFFQLIVLVIQLIFLVKTKDRVIGPTNFGQLIKIESIILALLMLGISGILFSNALDRDTNSNPNMIAVAFFIVLALLELLPIRIIQNRPKIN